MSEPPATEPVITGRQDWEAHHPGTVDVIGTKEQKKSNEKILTIEGMEGKYSPNDAYTLAKKEGNKPAAYAYAKYIIDSNPEIVANMIAQHGNERPILMPVDAIEYAKGSQERYNPIARAAATILSERTEWELDGDNGKPSIYQSNKVGRTGAPLIRFEKHPTFDGPVEAGRNYIIIDDHFHNGGTIRSAMDHIETHGGKVVGATALMSSHFGGAFKPTPEDINHAKTILGEGNYDALHQKVFGVSGEHNLFTHAELEAFNVIRNQILRKHKGNDLQTDDAIMREELYEKINHEIQSTAEVGKTALASQQTNSTVDGRGKAAPGTGGSGINQSVSSPGQPRPQESSPEINTQPAVPVQTLAALETNANPSVATSTNGTAGEWNSRLNSTSSKLGTASLAINLADAAINKDPVKAAEIGGTTLAMHTGMKVAGKVVGVELMPVVGQAVGGVLAGKDAYDAATTGHTGRAAISGVEATLYTVSAGAWTATATDCWNPTVVAPAAVALVSGGAAVTITAAKGLYDNCNTITGWFGHQENPPPAEPLTPLQQPIPTVSPRTSRDFNTLKVSDATALLAATSPPANAPAFNTPTQLAVTNRIPKPTPQAASLDA